MSRCSTTWPLTVADLEDGYSELSDQLDAVDEDLYSLEEDFYEEDDDYDEDDDVFYEVTCPSLPEDHSAFRRNVLLKGEIECPECGESLEFDLDDCDCCCDDDCDCGCDSEKE